MAGKKGRSGLTTKLTPERQKVILESIAAGVPAKYAAQRAGLTPQSISTWKAKGRKGTRGIYVDFLEALKKAEAEAVAASLGRIRQAGRGGQVIERTTTTTTRSDGTTVTKTVEKVTRGEWTADAWFLERCHPAQFARRDPSDHKKDKNTNGTNTTQAREFMGLLAAFEAATRAPPDGAGEPGSPRPDPAAVDPAAGPAGPGVPQSG